MTKIVTNLGNSIIIPDKCKLGLPKRPNFKQIYRYSLIVLKDKTKIKPISLYSLNILENERFP